MQVLHEDEALLVVNKPAGVAVHPSSPVSTVSKPSKRRLCVTEHLTAYYKSINRPLPETLVSDPRALERRGPHHCDSPPYPAVDVLVHRLDQGTSGVLFLAKTADAATALRQQFKDRRVKKAYIAVTQGGLQGPTTVSSAIGRSATERRKMLSARQVWGVCTPNYAGTSAGKLRGAITHLKPLLFNGRFQVVWASPVTGRTHQIRLHLQMLKKPIIGDSLYGDAVATAAFQAHMTRLRGRQGAGMKAAEKEEGRQLKGAPTAFLPPQPVFRGVSRVLLHAATVCCVHPTTGEPLRVSAPLPSDMREALDAVSPLWRQVPELCEFAETPSHEEKYDPPT
ncbi:uncharacterized protein LOC34620325 [Cyclospora cayetanensis]|uniref:Uncharacterized protein LOC34620325 n=1 Tax=Cyclospora cayetanensis TaxID=88456 RepID=A0A6P5WEW2_9EIME|nr:uncharacterized protein LOC34620325 [Cyclospora cayetanensis]